LSTKEYETKTVNYRAIFSRNTSSGQDSIIATQ